jgi:hypothetical protein
MYCLSSANPIGETGSGYPTNVYDGNRLSLPILRQKIALSDVWCLLTCRMVVVMRIEYLEYNSSTRTEKTLNKRILKYCRIKQSETNKKRTETNEKIEQLMNSTETGNEYK